MAIDFPSSPTDGQVYGSYTWDNSVGVWRTTPDTASGLPAGSIMAWGGATAPSNWLICDGSAVSRSTYASLFNAIGIQYGSGDGSTTFNIPDLRGRVPVGKNSATFSTLGATGGAETITLDSTQIPSHTHTISIADPGHTHSNSLSNNTVASNTHTHPAGTLMGRLFQGYYQAASGATWTASNSNNYSIPGASSGTSNQGLALGGDTGNNSGATTVSITNALATTGITASASSTGGGGSHSNIQPYQVINFIIKISAGVSSGDSELATRVGAIETTTVRSVALGGTGASNAAGALTNLGAAPAAGSSNITTLGTITTGTWNATSIDITKGGTGATTGSGLVPIIPSSVSISGGTSSTDVNGEITFSGVTSIAANGIFSSNYRNYRIIMTVTCLNTVSLMYRLRTGGTDNSTANYYFQELYAGTTTVGASAFTAATTGRIGYQAANMRTTQAFDVINPYNTQQTEMMNLAGRADTNVYIVYSGHTGATSFDGINFSPAAGTLNLTGTIRIYGYR